MAGLRERKKPLRYVTSPEHQILMLHIKNWSLNWVLDFSVKGRLQLKGLLLEAEQDKKHIKISFFALALWSDYFLAQLLCCCDSLTVAKTLRLLASNGPRPTCSCGPKLYQMKTAFFGIRPISSQRLIKDPKSKGSRSAKLLHCNSFWNLGSSCGTAVQILLGAWLFSLSIL